MHKSKEKSATIFFFFTGDKPLMHSQDRCDQNKEDILDKCMPFTDDKILMTLCSLQAILQWSYIKGIVYVTAIPKTLPKVKSAFLQHYESS